MPFLKPAWISGSSQFTYCWSLAWRILSITSLACAAAAAAKSLQSCPTLCDPIDGSPPGSPVPGILQAITLEWVVISFSNARKWKVKVKSLSRVRFVATPWTAAYQAPPSMGFSRQEYWSGVPLPSPKEDIRHHKDHHFENQWQWRRSTVGTEGPELQWTYVQTASHFHSLPNSMSQSQTV